MSVTVPFTQFLRPDGRKRPVEIDVPDDVGALALALIAAGYHFEIEELMTGTVNMDCLDEAQDEQLAQELCPNGPQVPETVHRLIRRAHAALEAKQ